MELSKIRRRLTKLLALSASPNKAEAELAMEKCAELMEKYNIRTIDVDEKTGRVDVVVKAVPGYHAKHKRWETQLAACIAEAFDAVAVINQFPDSWEIVFVATVTDYEFIVNLYKRLRRIISKQASGFTSGVDKAKKEELDHNFKTGMIETIYERLLMMYKRRPDTREMVLFKKDAIHNTVMDIWGDISKAPPTEVHNYYAMMSGKRAGEHVCLGKSLTGDKPEE